jgi:hypothetical protein
MSEPEAVEPVEPMPTGAEPAERPADVPDKFWDGTAGAIRTDMLLKSYLELERKLERYRADRNLFLIHRTARM